MKKSRSLILLLYFFIVIVLGLFLTSQYFQYKRNLMAFKDHTDIIVKSELVRIYKDFKREANNISLAIELGIKSLYKQISSYSLLVEGLKETRRVAGLKEIFFMDTSNRILLPQKRLEEGRNIPSQWVDLDCFSNISSMLKLINFARKKKKVNFSVVFLPYFERTLSEWRKEPFLIILVPIFKGDRYCGCGIGILNLKRFFEKYLYFKILYQKYGDLFFAVLDSKNRIIYSKGRVISLKDIRLSSQGTSIVPYNGFYIVKMEFTFLNEKKWSFVFGYPLTYVKKGVQPYFIENIVWSTVAIFFICMIFFTIATINRRNFSLISRYHYAVEHLMNPFVFLGADGNIMYANRSFKEIFGVDESQNIRSFIALQGEDSDLSEKEFMERIGKKESFTSVHSFKVKSGGFRYFRVMLSPVTFEGKKDSFIAGDFSDITEIIELEKKLEEYATGLEKMVEERTNEVKEREREYRQIFDNRVIGIAVLDTNGDLLFYNKTFKDLSEYSDIELKQINFKELCSPTDQDMLISLFKACLDKGEVFQREIKFFPKRKKTIFVDVFLQRTIYKGDPAVLVFVYDVTKRKILENKLREQERIAILGEMAAGVAHDINNLFMAISGHLELASNMIDESKEITRTHLNSSLSLIREGEAIVRRLYAYAQKQIRSSETIDLNELVKDTVMLIRPIWKDISQKIGKEIKIREEYGEIKPIIGNSAEIKEVFVNLIKNAVEAMPEGGEIVISSWMKNGKVYVMVKDTGTGIPEDVKFKIFDPFFSTKGHQGSGLGLAVSLGIVKAYGGNIEVRSKEGEGSAFIVSFPVAPEDLLKPKEKEDKRASYEFKKTQKVLVVEDEKEVLDVIKNMIELLGVDVMGTISPKEGLGLFEKYKDEIGLVITDLGMPEMSGFELSQKIRKISKEVNIVLLTGWGLTIEEDKKREHRIDEILSKPITLETLKKILNRYLK